ncbi:Bifunctional NAD(P)H-hydrate repair enzyme Nnr (Includes: ADP-dependent (S)-NAD(P)H-hydrate dehydratase; NAD(P)H-hydrate epimerase) [Candidatus Sulfopaludibacter sp. SbA3]|nr:Bifunctional NAD(P)H-hydrate repair enzyme Nnr (Includes: ADP-dependent (S)-NAD(P)H-hydrate dehydratase; NAD(P)H-hydrate epimerase) [Candidatus Sulfopaludibacter sp. SbA3]
MKVLTAAQMREVDRRTVQAGIPGIVMMENAGHRVVEFLTERFAPLSTHRIVVLCGKGNNGGDGMAIARQLYTRCSPEALYVLLLASQEELSGEALANYQMLTGCGCPILHELPAAAQAATLVVDALLGTGLNGGARGVTLDAIRAINTGFPLAKVVAVDIPSGMPSDTGDPVGEFAPADYTVTFTAPKVAHVLAPNCDFIGELVVRQIGTRPDLYGDCDLSMLEPAMFRKLLGPRPPDGHKGTFGHVLVVAGSRGKTGAATMCGLGALRAGAGLVTVAAPESAVAAIAVHTPELMTEPVAETPHGTMALNAELDELAVGKTVIAVGPGLGRDPAIAELVLGLNATCQQPMVMDADALVGRMAAPPQMLRVITPHPGEMSRLMDKSVAEVQKDRVATARNFAAWHNMIVVLKGQRTVIAFPDGVTWVNPTGTPAMGTGGSGDVLTGLIAGFIAQFPKRIEEAVGAAVYLHGLAGELAVKDLGEKSLIATDILRYLPKAMEACADVPHRH